jgi:hypothetical protein
MEQLASKRTDYDEIRYFDVLKIYQKLKFSLKSDKNNGHFTWRLMNIFNHISLSSS